jgi:hypothetical protein
VLGDIQKKMDSNQIISYLNSGLKLNLPGCEKEVDELVQSLQYLKNPKKNVQDLQVDEFIFHLLKCMHSKGKNTFLEQAVVKHFPIESQVTDAILKDILPISHDQILTTLKMSKIDHNSLMELLAGVLKENMFDQGTLRYFVFMAYYVNLTTSVTGGDYFSEYVTEGLGHAKNMYNFARHPVDSAGTVIENVRIQIKNKIIRLITPSTQNSWSYILIFAGVSILSFAKFLYNIQTFKLLEVPGNLIPLLMYATAGIFSGAWAIFIFRTQPDEPVNLVASTETRLNKKYNTAATQARNDIIILRSSLEEDYQALLNEFNQKRLFGAINNKIIRYRNDKEKIADLKLQWKKLTHEVLILNREYQQLPAL